jgi:hypothetical protein
MCTPVNLFNPDLEVETGSHIILLYQKESDLIEILPGYFGEGLKKSDICIYVNSSDFLYNQVLKEIEFNNLINNKIINEKMIVLKSDEVYSPKTKLDADKIYSQIDAVIQENTPYALRTFGDMTWANDKVFDEVYNYERGLTTRYYDKNVIFLCSYLVSQLDIARIIQLIQSHTLILYKENDVWKISATVERKIYDQKIEELEQFNRVSVGREIKMIELKEKIAKLEAELKEYQNASK